MPLDTLSEFLLASNNLLTGSRKIVSSYGENLSTSILNNFACLILT